MNYNPTEICLRGGEILVHAGDPLKGIVTVKSGRLKRYRVYQSRPFLAGLLKRSESTGLAEVLSGVDSHRETLEAIGETVVTIQSVAECQAWTSRTPSSVLEALRGSTESFYFERYLKRPIELLPVRARVAATLWFLAKKHGRADGTPAPNVASAVIDLDLTREEVAHLAGTVYESVIRTLTSLKKEGVIDINGRILRILNEDQLARVGQIVVGDGYDENTVSQNHSSSNDSSATKAC